MKKAGLASIIFFGGKGSWKMGGRGVETQCETMNKLIPPY